MLTDLPAWAQALLLGVVQGLTEFLPVSSSAHLVLLPEMGGGDYLGKGFDVALHAGTLVAVVGYFRAELARLLPALLGAARTGRLDGDPWRLQAVLIVLALVPAGLAGLLLEEHVESFHHVPLIAALLIVFGLLLEAADRWGRQARRASSLRGAEALLIGLAQAVALVPGVSRSGATMTAGLALGLTREEAARFSFLLSVPLIAAAALLKLPEMAGDPLPLGLGMAGAALSGLVSIHFLLRYLRGGGVLPFVAYRVVFGILLLAWWWQAPAP